jgi:PIN domain nuclease of toxin-antitoxin system
MRVVADSHAIVWYVQGSPRLSERAAAALSEAEASDGIVVSVATLVDLWYVTQTTQGVTANDLATLRSTMVASPKVDLHPIDVAVADAAVSIPRDALGDPWDRFILATAQALQLPLVTRDRRIQKTKAIETVW